MEIKLKKIDYINKHTKNHNIILQNINATIKDNQITTFMGPSGSGKTTLAEILGLLKNQTNGEIQYNDFIITSRPNKEKLKNLKPQIGLVYQSAKQQFFLETVKEEIEFAIDNLGYKTKDKEKRIQDSLKIVGLDSSYLFRKPYSLSKGEQTKLSLAIILSCNPKVIILDEPTTDLDGNSKKELIQLIKIMKLRYSKTIVIFSKDSDFVHAISDYIYIINQGKIIFKGDKYKVLTNYKILNKNNLAMPKLIQFSYLVENKKNVKIGYRDDINDLMKDIYRYVR